MLQNNVLWPRKYLNSAILFFSIFWVFEKILDSKFLKIWIWVFRSVTFLEISRLNIFKHFVRVDGTREKF